MNRPGKILMPMLLLLAAQAMAGEPGKKWNGWIVDDNCDYLTGVSTVSARAEDDIIGLVINRQGSMALSLPSRFYSGIRSKSETFTDVAVTINGVKLKSTVVYSAPSIKVVLVKPDTDKGQAFLLNAAYGPDGGAGLSPKDMDILFQGISAKAKFPSNPQSGIDELSSCKPPI
ncbi:hypothetical protein ACK303_12945 [Aeromonas caviae]